MGKLSCGLSIPGVFEHNGRYYRVQSQGSAKKWVALSRIDEGREALYRALYELEQPRPGTIAELLTAYRALGMEELKEATRADYVRMIPRLERVFGRVPIGALRASQVAVFLEKRRQAGRGAVRANRERAVLASAYRFAMRQGWAESNPCRGVSRNKESPRKRYVTNEEFMVAFDNSPPPFQDLLAVAYLTGIRSTDLFALKRAEHLNPEGLRFVESKTRKLHIQEWTSAVRFFVRRSMERAPEAELVLTNKFGKPWTVWAVNSQMARLDTEHGVKWAFKDLRAKSQSDAAHSTLGHDKAMEQLYRKVIRTRPVR